MAFSTPPRPCTGRRWLPLALLAFVAATSAAADRRNFTGADGLPVDAPPVPVRMATPDYPTKALRNAIGGRTVACFTVSAKGRVRDAVVIESSSEMFSSATLKAVNKSTFKPARRGNEAVVSELCRTYVYSLEDRGDW